MIDAPPVLTQKMAVQAARIFGEDMIRPFSERQPYVAATCAKQGIKYRCRVRAVGDRAEMRFRITIVREGKRVYGYAHDLVVKNR